MSVGDIFEKAIDPWKSQEYLEVAINIRSKKDNFYESHVEEKVRLTHVY